MEVFDRHFPLQSAWNRSRLVWPSILPRRPRMVKHWADAQVSVLKERRALCGDSVHSFYKHLPPE